MFLLESFEWLHRLHSHDEARRVADRSSGIWHFIEGGEREIGQVAAGSAWKFRGEDPTIPIRGVYLNLHIRDLQGDTQLLVVHDYNNIIGSFDTRYLT